MNPNSETLKNIRKKRRRKKGKAIYQLCQSMPGTEQGQAGTSSYKAGTNREKEGTNRDKQGQTGTAPFCRCMSVLVPVGF